MKPSDNPRDFDCSAAPKVFGPFQITDNRTGKPAVRWFVLIEASETAHATYKDMSLSGMVITANEKTDERKAQMQGVSLADSTLISHCLVEVEENGTPKKLDPWGLPVTMGNEVAYVRALPRSVTSRLYAKVREMSGMDEDDETVESLQARIKSDTAKIERLQKDGPPGK